ncbi:hypothetical protein BO70DRAFT_400664 [Aspergillus heteromorphus CBS 117.55]|uniref:Uncharacterized protein n=1 Tax=Aspergillus heteromorphus CBS 117.55 TaxID=1448321 RepID=A0A317V1D2_9EURO|nr:uncharacterized protein BO70DRAFT_400664 [Aspergillus heteromorphus CBS 117.55]PWY67201.1 hypothetical protein BO70DRAFT_400664 [Aspergillus heteromorphus CBS 117.55]
MPTPSPKRSRDTKRLGSFHYPWQPDRRPPSQSLAWAPSRPPLDEPTPTANHRLDSSAGQESRRGVRERRKSTHESESDLRTSTVTDHYWKIGCQSHQARCIMTR